ncbi:substrate-binding domain-containing protein [Cellulomonas sp. ATA003]|uniref:LacI family DNA-binding transcriptional regulator n=1 Tax=Cellulomonas sp. ATA003 TaxID=3073064 RepID=UPI002872B251|nr:substrate-binding domain-containing protein [Cellulomonas sp. ATA003]WNB86610.1 substrate-binding domain-containing protein [Cellulomonas sp. ATA003]
MAEARSRPTLDTVARAAGVSKATVSKVLNGRREVAASTRERVLATVAELEYAPTTGSRVAQHRRSVTVVFSAVVDPYSAQVLSGLLSAGADHGVDVVVTHVPGAREAQGRRTDELGPEWFRSLARQGHVGVIGVTTALTHAQVQACADAGLQLVVIDPVSVGSESAEGIITVSATNWAGGMQATEHLLELGHRRIGFAGGLPASRPGGHRLHGHTAALTTWGQAVDRTLIRHEGFSYEDGRAMGDALLDLPQPPTAIVAGSDTAALGVMEAAHKRGLRLPEDLSIVGFDDTPLAVWTSPQLTTVRQPMREMGRQAVRTLLSIADGARPETHHFELATTLVVRTSTCRVDADDQVATTAR